MGRATIILIAVLALCSCGRTAALAEPTTAPTLEPTATPASAPPTATPASAPPTATTTSLPRLIFFLPTDFPAAYPDYRYSDDYPAEQGYSLTLYPAGIAADPPTDTFITIAGGELAAFLVEQAFAEPPLLSTVETLTIRNLEGRLALGPGGLFLAWVEDGTPYAIDFKGVDEQVIIDMAESLQELGQSAWLEQMR